MCKGDDLTLKLKSMQVEPDKAKLTIVSKEKIKKAIGLPNYTSTLQANSPKIAHITDFTGSWIVVEFPNFSSSSSSSLYYAHYIDGQFIACLSKGYLAYTSDPAGAQTIFEWINTSLTGDTLLYVDGIYSV